MKPTAYRALLASALVALSLPAAAQINAAVTKQASPINPKELAIVELGTLSVMPRQLVFKSLSTPEGVWLSGVNTTSSCPEAAGANRCRQYFTFGLDAQTSRKCNLTGKYVALFDVVCLDQDGKCKPGPHEVGFDLKSENFCKAHAVDTTNAPAMPSPWRKLWSNFGKAKDVAVGADAVLWYVANNNLGLVQRASLKTNEGSASMGTSAARIDAGNGQVWAVQPDGKIAVRYPGSNNWQTVPGAARDIGVGADGSVWCIGTNAVPGGFGIYRWNGAKNNWDGVTGGAVRIDVDPKGNAWVVNDAGDVFRWNGSTWLVMPGVKAVDIGVGANGAGFVVGTDGKVYKAGARGWEQRGGAGVKYVGLTVTADGMPLALDETLDAWIGEP